MSRKSTAFGVGAIVFLAAASIASIALWGVWKARLEVLDSALDDWASRQATGMMRTDAARAFINLPPGLGASDSVELLLLVTDERGAVLSRSPDWPHGVDLSRWTTSIPQQGGKPSPTLADGPLSRSADVAGDSTRHGPDQPPGPSVQPPNDYPILRTGTGDLPLRHFETHGADGTIHWVAVPTGRLTAFAGIRVGVIAAPFDWLEELFAALAILASVLSGALAYRVLSRQHREQLDLVAWIRGAAEGMPIADEPPGSSPDLADIRTQLGQLHHRLATSLEQAYRFTGDAAHELRSPLTAMQVKVDRLISRGATGSEFQSDLADIADDIHRLSSLVRRLLWMSLADAGRLQLHRTDNDLSALLRDVTDELATGGNGLTVHVQIASNLLVDGDSTLLEQALTNLITNAVKHNRPGGWIRVTADEEDGHVLVCISNSVAHPLPALRERVFERFYRGGFARAQRDSGSGIGLSLAREIARVHGGDIVVAEAPVGEAFFVLRLPTLRAKQ